MLDWASKLSRYTNLGQMWSKIKFMKGSNVQPLKANPPDKANERKEHTDRESSTNP